MPKHKKTRAQKMKADERRSSLSLLNVPSDPTYTFSLPSSSVNNRAYESAITVTQQLVKNDLKKTAIVSVIILFLQVILFVLFKNHVLAISFVRY